MSFRTCSVSALGGAEKSTSKFVVTTIKFATCVSTGSVVLLTRASQARRLCSCKPHAVNIYDENIVFHCVFPAHPLDGGVNSEYNDRTGSFVRFTNFMACRVRIRHISMAPSRGQAVHLRVAPVPGTLSPDLKSKGVFSCVR